MVYTPAWEPLADALRRVVAATKISEQQAKTDICNAIGDLKITVRVFTGERAASGDKIRVPPRLNPDDFDWTNSRPISPWFVDRMPGQHPYYNGGYLRISSIELLKADVQAVLCHGPSTATQLVTTPRSEDTIGVTSTSHLPSRKRAKPVQYHIGRAVEALAKQHGGKFPPDGMPVSERNRLIIEWLAGDNDPVKPSERTLRDYFRERQH